jgi:hypothetical protein
MIAPPPLRPGRRWWTWAVPLSLLLAASVGAGAAWFAWRTHRLPDWLRHAEAAPSVPPETAPASLLPAQRREQFLKEAVDHYVKPTKDPATDPDYPLGVRHATELAVFYFEEWRPDDAELFFRRLEDPKLPQAYGTLARLGHAVVLSLQNKAAESDKLFQDLFRADHRKQTNNPLLFSNVPLRQWLVRALDRNEVNATPDHPFPTELRPIRQWLMEPPGAKKAPDKGTRANFALDYGCIAFSTCAPLNLPAMTTTVPSRDTFTAPITAARSRPAVPSSLIPTAATPSRPPRNSAADLADFSSSVSSRKAASTSSATRKPPEQDRSPPAKSAS